MISHVVGISLSSLLLSFAVPAHLVAVPVAMTAMPHDMELLLPASGSNRRNSGWQVGTLFHRPQWSAIGETIEWTNQ